MALTNRVCVTNEVTVRSVSGPAFTQIRGRIDLENAGCGPAAVRCVYMSAGRLAGFTLAAGYSSDSGSGWYPSLGYLEQCGGGAMLTGPATLSNCIVLACQAYLDGGGVFMDRGAVLATSCVISNTIYVNYYSGAGVMAFNHALIDGCFIADNGPAKPGNRIYGGGVCAYYGGLALLNSTLCRNNGDGQGGGAYIEGGFDMPSLVSNCVVYGNRANSTWGSGGGIYAYRYVTVVDCLITNNTTYWEGNGIYVYQQCVVQRCVIAENYGIYEQNYGGGAAVEYESLMENCLIVSNRAGNYGGGGVYLYRNATLRNCTIADNASTAPSGGLYGDSAPNYADNCIVYGNLPGNYGAGVTFSNTCSLPLPDGPGNVAADPRFVNGYHLHASSLCVNAGANSAAALPHDLDWLPRIQEDRVDMGCYENFSIPPPEIFTPVYVAPYASGWYYSTNAAVALTGAKTNAAWVVRRDNGVFTTNEIVQELSETNWADAIDFGWPVVGRGETGDLVYACALSNFSELALSGVTTLRVINDIYAFVDITNEAAAVPFNVTSYTLAGTNAGGIVGMMWVSNEANGAVAAFPAPATGVQAWTAVPILLGGPVNRVVVYGTNIFGRAVSDALLITRVLPPAGVTNHAAIGGAHRWPFLNWADAATNIQDAVNAARDGNLVLVSNGVYDLGGAAASGLFACNRVLITNAITLRGWQGPSHTTILGSPDLDTDGPGPGAVRCLYMTAGAVCDVTLSNGATHIAWDWGWYPDDDYFDASGGGALLRSGALLSNCVVSANVAFYDGGGIFADSNSVIIYCAVTDNRIVCDYEYGGGICAFNSVHIIGCDVVRNVAYNGYGGGIYTDYDGVYIRDCRVAHNRAGYDGGGICSYAMDTAPGLISNCTVEANLLQGSWCRGGGIYARTFVAMVDSRVRENMSSHYAGGVYADYYSTLTRCQITRNSAAYAGGLYISYYGTVDTCVISENIATNSSYGYYGGVYAYGNTLITQSDISRNYAELYGGGARFEGSVSASRCIFSGNVCTQEMPWSYAIGGVFAGEWSGADTLVNCLVISNMGWNAGGVMLEGGLGRIRNTTIADNSATLSNGTGGIILGSGTLQNSIIFANEQGNCSNFSGSVSFTCAVPLPAGTGNIASDPFFTEGYHLDHTSPTINAGNSADAALPVDLDGVPRILQDVVDMGCYEQARLDTLQPPVISNPVVVARAATGVYLHASYQPLWIDGAKDNGNWVATRLAGDLWLTNGIIQSLNDTIWSQLATIVWTTTGTVETNAFAFRSTAEPLTPVSFNATVLLVVKDLYVHTAFTGTPGIVSHGIDTLILAGTNSHQITGGMWIHNATNGATAVLDAAPGWLAPALPLAFGANVITVYATNAFGTIASDTITITRASVPAITITNTPAVYRVPFRHLWHTLAGDSSNLAGDILISNQWRGTASAAILPAASAWSYRLHLPHYGTYLVTVCGTNAAGDAASTSCTIIRAAPQTIWMDR